MAEEFPAGLLPATGQPGAGVEDADGVDGVGVVAQAAQLAFAALHQGAPLAVPGFPRQGQDGA